MSSSTLKATKRQLRIYRKRHLKFDIVAATVVFLIAIPLCLGIALASGAPLLSGLLSGIIGGVIVGGLSGSHVSVSGPAAGMAALVLSAITQLGHFEVFLLALVLAGLIQILIGIFRAGFVAEYIPSNVIQGLLCAIGILIIVKQLPFAFTLLHTIAEFKAELIDLSGGVSFKSIYELSFHINSGATLISLLSLAILVYVDRTKITWLKSIPGAIIVVVLGVTMNELFLLTNLHVLQQHEQHLVNLPEHESILHFISLLQTPDWSAFTQINVYFYAFIIAIVSALENLLNLKAGEKLDNKHRYCSKDRELIVQGIGNCLAGLIGGIPITSVIVRTSVNIQTGARTKMAAVFHGLFILFAIMSIPTILNRIPLSSLAAILIYTGYKLTHPSIYRKIYRQGLDRFIPFLATVISILIFNLLLGILIGLLISLFFILKSNSQVRLDIIKEIYPTGMTNRLVLPQQTTFLNKASLIAELDTIPRKSKLIIDARYSDFIDKEIIEFIKEYKNELAPYKQVSLNLIGFKDRYKVHNYIDFINVTTYDVQAKLTPIQILNLLQEGNQRFLNDKCIHRSSKIDIQSTATTQYPMAVVLGCIDSRVPVETVLDMTVGDLFCTRVAGNVVNDDILASIEYACHVIGSKLIVVLGHTQCGAIRAACDDVKHGHITQLLSKIKPAIDAEKSTLSNRDGQNETFVHHVMELNVAHTISQIYMKSAILRDMINNEAIAIVGATYDVQSGFVNFQDFSPYVEQLNHAGCEQLIKKMKSLI